MLKLRNVSFSYINGKTGEEIPVLSNIVIDFPVGEISVLLGPSGCGKTTLLNLIASLLQPTEGTITHCDFGEEGQQVGYVFQTPSLLPWRTIKDNALFGAEITRRRDEATESRCQQLFHTYGLVGFEESYPTSLSGGMQQRVSIIRAVLSGSKIILLDEPFSNSDFIMRRELQEELSRLVTENQLTAILVTHDIEEAVKIGDKITVLTPRPATVRDEIRIDTPRARRLKGGARSMKDLIHYIEKIESVFANG